MLTSVASDGHASGCHAKCVEAQKNTTATSLLDVNNTLGLRVTITQNVWRPTRST